MRVVQLIDSLEAGGAERMAVNYANALGKKIDFSGLVTTRKEGVLKNQIDQSVSYLFLERKAKIDFSAVLRLRKFLKINKVEILHAHGTSFFIAVLVKLIHPKIRIIWHDHYGTRPDEAKSKNKTLLILSTFFSSIFVVNLQLEDWHKKNMKCSKVLFIPNFATAQSMVQETELKGIDGKRIVFLANLKNPKNHLLVLKAFRDLRLNEIGWSLHLIGKDYFDSYSDEIKKIISVSSLQNDIHLYGSKNDIKYILSQSAIGILASTQEGFPVTLLEYGQENVVVLSTNVGHCGTIICDNFSGLLFDPNSEFEIKNQLMILVNDESLRVNFAANFKQFIAKNYTEEIVIEKLIKAYKNL